MSVAARIFGPTIEASAAAYIRARDLPKLIAVWPGEIKDHSTAGTQHLIGRLRKVAGALSTLGATDHWSYEIGRHVAILAALKAERQNLARPA